MEYKLEPTDAAALKMLMPVWDVVIRYTTAGLMAIALSTTALQAAKDNLVCVPAVTCKGAKVICDTSARLESTCKLNFVMDKLSNDSEIYVMTSMVDRRHYDFIDTLCFHKALEWYPRYFPFILVGMATSLLVVSNIWVLYPRTGSVLSQFVQLTKECYNEDVDSEEEAMDSKSLFKKVDHFAEVYEKLCTVANSYKVQACFEMVLSLISIIFIIYHCDQLNNAVDCKVDEVFNIPYQVFRCSRFVAPYYRAVTYIFGLAMSSFLVASIIAIYWAFKKTKRSCKNIYADVNVENTCDISGDLAFLYSLLEWYNPLYCNRLNLILTKVKRKRE